VTPWSEEGTYFNSVEITKTLTIQGEGRHRHQDAGHATQQ
jgi:hypothetical protein